MYAVREYSAFTLLHGAVQFPQPQLLEETAFSPVYILASFATD